MASELKLQFVDWTRHCGGSWVENVTAIYRQIGYILWLHRRWPYNTRWAPLHGLATWMQHPAVTCLRASTTEDGRLLIKGLPALPRADRPISSPLTPHPRHFVSPIVIFHCLLGPTFIRLESRIRFANGAQIRMNFAMPLKRLWTHYSRPHLLNGNDWCSATDVARVPCKWRGMVIELRYQFVLWSMIALKVPKAPLEWRSSAMFACRFGA
jgi:hypothetical protein